MESNRQAAVYSAIQNCRSSSTIGLYLTYIVVVILIALFIGLLFRWSESLSMLMTVLSLLLIIIAIYFYTTGQCDLVSMAK